MNQVEPSFTWFKFVHLFYRDCLNLLIKNLIKLKSNSSFLWSSTLYLQFRSNINLINETYYFLNMNIL